MRVAYDIRDCGDMLRRMRADVSEYKSSADRMFPIAFLGDGWFYYGIKWLSIQSKMIQLASSEGLLLSR